MAMLGRTINANELPAGSDFDVLPAGWYQAKVKATELKQTKAGNGEYISLQFEILGPSHQGRVVFSNINIMNPNPKAEEIGLSQLNSLLSAIGLSQISDTDQMINGEAMIKLSIKRSEEYGDKNEVKGYKAVANAMPTMANSAITQQVQSQQVQHQQSQNQQSQNQHAPAMGGTPQQPLWRQQPQPQNATNDINADIPF